MTKKHLLAAKVDTDFHKQSHDAAAALDTNVSAEIVKLMQRLIRKAGKMPGNGAIE